MTLSELRQWHIEQAIRHYDLVVNCKRSLPTRAMYSSLLGEYRKARFHDKAASTLDVAMSKPWDTSYNALAPQRESAFLRLRDFAQNRDIPFRYRGFDIAR